LPHPLTEETTRAQAELLVGEYFFGVPPKHFSIECTLCKTTISSRISINEMICFRTLKTANPGDLSCVFPCRHSLGIIEMLEALEKLAPGVYSRHTMLYGVEVKFSTNLK
jgi:hypothetical protein